MGLSVGRKVCEIAGSHNCEKNAFGVTVARPSWRRKVWVRIPLVFKVIVVDSQRKDCLDLGSNPNRSTNDK